MADFVAVLRKTIGALGDNTPAMREKVYEKARATIEAKLAALNPPPPAAVIERQRKTLDDAIATVRAEYDGSSGPREETFEDVFSSLATIADERPRPATPPAPVRAVAPAPAPRAQSADGDPAAIGVPEPETRQAGSATVDTGTPPPPPAGRRRPTQAASRGRTGLVAALVIALLVVGGGAYALWQSREGLLQMAGLADGPAATTEDAAIVAEDLETPEPEAPAEQEPQEVAAAPATTPSDETSPPSAETEAEKFTQRLLPDGSEVDEGPAGEPRSVGEGSSVASAQVPPRADASAETQEATAAEPDGETATDTAQTGEGETATPDAAPEATAPEASEPAATEAPPSAVAVGQRAIFYEERTSAAQGSAETGAIVWSVVSESPGADLPPEPAIRAEATIPDKDIQLRMTIRRNGDETLPASHIVEMIFLTPDGFEGGAITNVARIAFKETEQAAGSPLIGIPAKIADGFFLIALGDAPAEVEANLTLLRRQSWIDIPIVYQSGRRALLSLEKGIPGDRVFQEALQAWTQESSG